MDELRDRIAAVLDQKVDGFWDPLEVADALISELGLRRETVGIIHRHVTEWSTDD